MDLLYTHPSWINRDSATIKLRGVMIKVGEWTRPKNYKVGWLPPAGESGIWHVYSWWSLFLPPWGGIICSRQRSIRLQNCALQLICKATTSQDRQWRNLFTHSHLHVNKEVALDFFCWRIFSTLETVLKVSTTYCKTTN